MQLKITGPLLCKKNHITFGRGKFYRSEDFHSFEDSAIWEVKSQIKRDFSIDFTKKVVFKFFLKREKDLDNLLGSVFDILQKSGLIQNDKEIVWIEAMKEKSVEEYCLITFDSL